MRLLPNALVDLLSPLYTSLVHAPKVDTHPPEGVPSGPVGRLPVTPAQPDNEIPSTTTPHVQSTISTPGIPAPAESTGGSPVAPADPDDGILFTTTARGHSKNYTPGMSAPTEPAGVSPVAPADPDDGIIFTTTPRGQNKVHTWDIPTPAEPVGRSPVVPADPDNGVLFTTTPRGQNKNYTPDIPTPAEPTVTEILPTQPWPSASEVTTYSAEPKTAAAEVSTSPLEVPSPATNPTTSPDTSSDVTSSYSASSLPSSSSPTSSESASQSISASAAFVSTTSSTSFSTSPSTISPSAAAVTTTPTNEPVSLSNGTSKTTKIAIAVPVSIIGTALLLALFFFLARRRRRQKQRNALPPSYDTATQQIATTSTQELMMARKPGTPSVPTPTMAMPTPRMPLIGVSSPSAENVGRTSSPGPSSRSTFGHRTSADGPRDSVAEIGVAVAVPMDGRWSATEETMERVGSVRSSRGRVSRLASPRMPFEDFEDDEVGVGIGIAVTRYDNDDGISYVSDDGRRGTGRDFDEVSIVSSFDGVSPIGQPERSQFR
ncbi:hypothetical protein N7535_000105 [Penicillium sp. DV-2018c]|nr:hypothetical protein N7461_006651 [Penicillium sp. DV-2018c]KAJ5581485.1 hypothetical protein N7535_000105 [Penicillium sp. DV-2018c]